MITRLTAGSFLPVALASEFALLFEQPRTAATATPAGNAQKLAILKTLDCIEPRRVEQALHRQFRHYRQSGEWFRLDDTRLSLLDSVLERLGT